MKKKLINGMIECADQIEQTKATTLTGFPRQCYNDVINQRRPPSEASKAGMRKMVYLDSFLFPDADREWEFRLDVKRTCYNTLYPFFLLSGIGLERVDFEPLTILHGGNGSGKTTVLNVIAEKLRLHRETPFNRSNFFQNYVDRCKAHEAQPIPDSSRMIVSDDVFDYMLNIRSLNEGIDRQRESIFEEHTLAKHSTFQVRSLEDYDELKRRNSARRKTQSVYAREQLMDNVRELSNGESANFYFTQRIGTDGLFLLDEPENSLSPKGQIELAGYLEEAVRYMGCQLVISTHSPFLLAMRGAKIYDMDTHPVDIKRWTELGEVKAYADFFASHREELNAQSMDD